MTRPLYTLTPTMVECQALQEALCERFGGEPTLDDPGLLEALLARPRSPHYGTLSLQAAALLQSFATTPVFRCHHGRFAIALTAAFLHQNGYRMQVEPAAAEHFLREHVIERGVDVERIADRIEHTMVARS